MSGDGLPLGAGVYIILDGMVMGTGYRYTIRDGFTTPDSVCVPGDGLSS